jgi:hypothetical protein
MGGAKPRYICWDLDETLGCFRPPEDTAGPSRRGLTRGISTLLEERMEAGCRHVVTTAAEAAYAEASLEEFGIRGFFERVFDRHTVCDTRFNKHYLPVAEALGISGTDAPDRMIVVGNLAKDAPADSDIVFLYHPNAVRYDAGVISRTLSYLELFGPWRAAHEALAGAANPHVLANLTETYESERLILDIDGIYSLLEGKIGLLGCHCGISSVQNGSQSPLFDRSVRRMVYLSDIAEDYAADIQEISGLYPRLALAVNQ